MFKNICWVNWLFTGMVVFFFIISVSSMLSGCGNKGSLYLPDNSSVSSSSNSSKKN